MEEIRKNQSTKVHPKEQKKAERNPIDQIKTKNKEKKHLNITQCKGFKHTPP